jgi:hypothetical protein
MDAQSLQAAYSQAGPASSSGQSQAQAAPQDITIPAQVVAQITQFIQQNDCTSVCKLIAGVISGGAQGAPSDNDGGE